MTDILNAIVLLGNFVLVPGLAYGSQLALGALGVTLIYGILRFSNLVCTFCRFNRHNITIYYYNGLSIIKPG